MTKILILALLFMFVGCSIDTNDRIPNISQDQAVDTKVVGNRASEVDAVSSASSSILTPTLEELFPQSTTEALVLSQQQENQMACVPTPTGMLCCRADTGRCCHIGWPFGCNDGPLDFSNPPE